MLQFTEKIKYLYTTVHPVTCIWPIRLLFLYYNTDLYYDYVDYIRIYKVPFANAQVVSYTILTIHYLPKT